MTNHNQTSLYTTTHVVMGKSRHEKGLLDFFCRGDVPESERLVVYLLFDITVPANRFIRPVESFVVKQQAFELNGLFLFPELHVARINLDSKFRGDGRVNFLAKLCGESHLTTRGRLIGIYFESYEQKIDVFTTEDIDVHSEWFTETGSHFADLMVKARLADDLGDGRFRIKGARERFQYLVDAISAGKRSVEARKNKYGTAQPVKDSLKSSKVVRTGFEPAPKVLEDITLPLPLAPAPAPDTPLDMDIKENTLSPVKNKKPRLIKPKPLPSEAEREVASDWLKFAKKEMPWKSEDNSWTEEKFAECISKIKEISNLNDIGMRAVLNFIQNDDFWRKNAISPLGLLKKSDKNGNRKIDNILIRMRTKTDRVKSALIEFIEGA